MASPLARLRPLLHLRRLSAASTPVLTSKKKSSRAALSLLKSEKNPTRIIDICRSAALSPTSSKLDRTALSIAISRLTASSALPAVRSFLDDLLADDPRFRPHAITLFCQAGMLDDAIRVFHDPPSLNSLNALLSACILAKNHDSAATAARIFFEFPRSYGITPNLLTYNTAIKAFCELGPSARAYSVFDEMSRRGIKPDTTTFCNALAGFYREERFDDVDRVMEMMERNNCGYNLATYNVRIQSLCKLKRSGDAKALFKEMLSMGVKPNWVTYSNLVVGFCKEGDIEEAKKLYKEMRSRGCVPGSSFYFTLVYYLCEAEEFGAALSICKEIMERNWVPCFSTMKMLVNGLVGESKVDDARDIIQKMKLKFPSNAAMWEDVEAGLPP